MPQVKLDAFGVVVSDMSKTIAFYEALGLTFAADAAEQGHVEVVLPGGLRLMFDTIAVVKSFAPDWAPPTGGHRMGLAFLCDSPAEVDATYAALIAAGHQGLKEPWDAFWGQRYAQVLDPDHNPVDLFAALPAQ